MKPVILALSLLSIPAFADYGHHRGHGRIGNEHAIGPARGYYDINSRGATCEGAHSMVLRRGAVIVYYGEDLYERVVRDGSFCDNDQRLDPFYANGCFVGWTCGEREGD